MKQTSVENALFVLNNLQVKILKVITSMFSDKNTEGHIEKSR